LPPMAAYAGRGVQNVEVRVAEVRVPVRREVKVSDFWSALRRLLCGLLMLLLLDDSSMLCLSLDVANFVVVVVVVIASE